MNIVGQGVRDGYLTPEQIDTVARDGLGALPVDGRRVLVIIPDGTRTMPMPLMFDLIERQLGPRVASLDYLVALGTHTPMNDAQLSAHVGRTVVNGRAGAHHIFNHRWDDPATYARLGVIPASDIADLTGGRLHRDVPVALNRLATEYDHVLICGPVFPHEVAGFSGGTKYLFPGIAAPEIIHFTHWLGALITSYEAIGTIDTAVRAVINRAAALLDTPLSLLALVVTHHGVAGMYCGDPARGMAGGRDPLVAAPHSVGRRALRSCARDHAGDVRRFVDRRERHVQERARRGRCGRGDHLRAARDGSEPHARQDD